MTDEQIDAITDAQWGKGCVLSQYMAHRAFARAILAAAAQTSAPVGWIPVTERLPKESDGTVAVLIDDGSVLTAWASYWHGACTDFAYWTFPHEDDGDSVITHWAPLPEIPQPVAQADEE